MIFLTVGSHEPFDRLVRGVDAWCGARRNRCEVFGQITGRAHYVPKHFRTVPHLSPAEFAERFRQASCIVSHAGMGTIINALVAGKPIAVMPRRGHLRETRNDHQYATVRRLKGRAGLLVTETEEDLPMVLDRLLELRSEGERVSRYADAALIDTLRETIHGKGGAHGTD